MPTFKEITERDFNNVIFNTDEFAEIINLYYNNEWRDVRAVIDSDAMTDRKRSASDNVPYIYKCGILLHLLKSELSAIPRKNNKIGVNDEEYTIVSVKSDKYTVTLELEKTDE